MAGKGTTIGSLFAAAVLIASTWLVVANFTDLRQLIAVLSTASGFWIAVGVALHLLYFVAYAVLYRLGFAIVGVERPTVQLLPVLFAGLFTNTVVPGGAGEAALFIDDAAQHGQSPSHAAVGVVLVLLLDLVTLLPFIGWGVFFLVRHGLFKPWDAIAVAFFFMYCVLLIAMLVLARRRPDWVHWLLSVVLRIVRRVGRWIHKPDLLSEAWPERTATRFGEAAAAIGTRPRQLFVSALWATMLHLINVIGLWAFLIAFGERVAIGGLLAAFSFGIVFFVIVVVPQAAAVVEAIMTLIFIRLGVMPAKAIAVTLAFRGVNFWLPLVVGLLFLWRIRRFGARSQPPGPESP